MKGYIVGFSGLISDGDGGTLEIAARISGAQHYAFYRVIKEKQRLSNRGAVLKEVVALNRDGKLPRPLCFFGHSMGGELVLWLCEQLAKHDITVDYVGVIDLTLDTFLKRNTKAGGNIRLLQEFHSAYRRVKFNGFNGKHEFYDLDKIMNANIGHSEAARLDFTQDKIVSTIAELTKGGKVPKPVERWTHLNFDREIFFDRIKESLFGTLRQKQVEGLERLLGIWEKHFVHWDMRELAYNLATSYHETGKTMQPIHEYGKDEYFKKYEPGARLGKALGNTEPGDGRRFRGAGDVQNTGRRNAQKATEELNLLFNLDIDLVANPDDRLDPLISGLSLFQGNHSGWWTNKRLPNSAGYGNWNMKGARSVVNGADRWEIIGDYAGHFLEALKAAAVPIEIVAQEQALPPVGDCVPNPGHVIAYLEQNYPKLDDQGREIVLATVDLLKPPDKIPKNTHQPNPSSEAGFLMPDTKGKGMFSKTFNIKSKTTLTGIFSVLAGLVLFIAPEGNTFLELVRSIYPEADPGTLVTGGLAIIFAREAISKNGNGS